jgi:hypothetical protein
VIYPDTSTTVKLVTAEQESPALVNWSRRSRHRCCTQLRQAALEPYFSTADRAPDCAEDPQHDTDHHKDSADGVQDRNACKITDQEKNDAEHDHGQSDPICRTLELADKECPIRQSRNSLAARVEQLVRRGGVVRRQSRGGGSAFLWFLRADGQ